MIKQFLVPALLVLTFAAGVASANEPAASGNAPQTAQTYNPMAWMNMMNTPAAGVHQLNLARPEGYNVFMNPMNYGQFMNPATYSQFMTPQFYMQFADPNNLMAWMNPNAYAMYMNPMAYSQMMNPAGYMQFMNPAMYMPMMNPASYQAYMNPNMYMQWMNPAVYTTAGGNMAAYGNTGGAAFNWFDPNAWSGMMMPQAEAQAQPESGSAQQ